MNTANCEGQMKKQMWNFFWQLVILVGSGIAKLVVVVPAILTFCLFTWQSIFNLSVLMNWFTSAGVAQDQESHQAVGTAVAVLH